MKLKRNVRESAKDVARVLLLGPGFVIYAFVLDHIVDFDSTTEIVVISFLMTMLIYTSIGLLVFI